MGSTTITMEDIKKIFQDMFQQHQEVITKKQEEMFKSHENRIMQLISRNTTLTNQRSDNLSKEIADLKESLEFTQEETEEKISKLNEKITSIKRNLFSLKKDIEVIQTTKQSWDLKLVDLEDRSRRNNLRINEIKEGKNETWEECEERVNCFLEEKLDMDTSNIWIERAHRVGEKKHGQERHIIVQFNSYKNKLDILRNCKKLKGTNFLIFEDFSKETASIRKEKWKEVVKNRKDGKISYSQYKTVICKERPQAS